MYAVVVYAKVWRLTRDSIRIGKSSVHGFPWAGCRAVRRAVAEPFVGTMVETFAQTIEWVS